MNFSNHAIYVALEVGRIKNAEPREWDSA